MTTRSLHFGGVRDTQFGPLVVVGFGDIYVEVFADTVARLAPISTAEALVMLDELKRAPLLRGARGETRMYRAALAGSSLVRADPRGSPELREIEINPLMVGPGGALAGDVRARLSE